MENNAQMYIDLGEIIGAKKNFLLIRDKSREELKKPKQNYIRPKKNTMILECMTIVVIHTVIGLKKQRLIMKLLLRFD